MAFTYVTNFLTAPGTEEEWGNYMRAWMDAMIAAGWRVLGSGDATGSFENTGQTAGATGLGAGGGFDILTNAGTGALGWKNQSFNNGATWIRLATPVGAAVYQEWVFQLHYRSGTGNFSQYQIRVSWNGFDQNDATDLLPPTATDDRCVYGSRYPANSTAVDLGYGAPLLPSGTSNRMHVIIGDAAEGYDWMMFTKRSSQSDGAFAVIGRLSLTLLYDRLTVTDPDPYVYLGAGSASSGSATTNFQANLSGALVDSRASTLTAPFKFEGVTPNALPGALAFFNRGEPADPLHGWYQMGLFRPVLNDRGWFEAGPESYDSTPIDIPCGPVGKADDSTLFFYKGIIQNRLIMFSSNDRAGLNPQVVQRPDSGPFRLHFHGFSLTWNGDPFAP